MSSHNATPKATVDRIVALAAEGMPATWIAEECGVGYETARNYARRAPRHAESTREWLSAWQAIVNTPSLLDLHYEIAPPTIQEIRVRRAA